jgi:hypothetical protein
LPHHGVRRPAGGFQIATTGSLIDRAKALLHEGNVRHLVVEKDGWRYADLPLTIVVLVGVFAIWVVAILGAIALLTGCHVTVVNREQPDAEAAEPPVPPPPVN